MSLVIRILECIDHCKNLFLLVGSISLEVALEKTTIALKGSQEKSQ